MNFSITKKELVYLALPLVLLLLVFPTVLFPNGTYITGSSDTQLVINSEQSVAEHPFSLWNNQWLTGIPEYANPLSDRFYPLFYPLFVVTQDPFIINFVIFVHLYIAFLCFYLFAGLVTKNPELRFVFSLFYIFSTTMLSRVFAGHVLILFALTWIPLLYYAFFKIVWDNEPTVKNCLLLTLSILLIFFTGAVYYLFYSCLVLLVFVIYYFIKKQISKGVLLALSGTAILSGLLFAVKFIPALLISSSLERIDPINSLGDGGSIESILASIIFGTPIDKVFDFWESGACIGIFIILLVIIALIFYREDRTIPAFFAILVTFLWAEGGYTIISVLHWLPILNNFRCAGRVLAALTPILLLFAILGFTILSDRIKNGELFTLTDQQKRNILIGVGLLVILKLCELPFQTFTMTTESGLSVLLVVAFIALIYFNRATKDNLFFFFVMSMLITGCLTIYHTIAPITIPILIVILSIVTLVVVAIAIFNRDQLTIPSLKTKDLWFFLIFGLLIVVSFNVSYLQTSDPKLNNSPAIPIVDKILADNTDGHQIWVYENGWAYQHLDFTYWFLKNGIHPVHSYYGYYMKTSVAPLFNVGNTTYFTSDYIIDTKYLENQQVNLPEVTFTINNISVYKPEHVLPSAFVIHEDHIVPATIEKFTPDEIRIGGEFSAGDMAVLKTAYYPGWKMNGQDMTNIGNMPVIKLSSGTPTITFTYEPLDFKVGVFFTLVGLFALFIIIIRRNEINACLLAASPVPEVKEKLVVKKKSKKRGY